MDTIFKRYSVRQFTDEKLTMEEIEKLMRAAMAAPSAGNQQPWEFYIAQDETTRLALATTSPFAGPAKHAPCVIVACRRTGNELRFPTCSPMDMSAAIENILLEAVDLGLGACWMALWPADERVAAASVAIGSPKGLEPFALIAVGHPDPLHAAEPKGATRYDETRVHWM